MKEDELLAWLRAREGEMALLLEALALAESPSLARSSLREALDLLAAELRAVGYLPKRVRGFDAGGDHLYARPVERARRAPRQLVVGHVDTVWPLGTVAAMTPRIEDGRLYGPGVYDMKGGLVQLVFALRALDALGLQPTITPVLFVNSDEEVGSGDSVRWIRMLARGAVRAFVLEPPAGSNGQLKTRRKGVGRFRLTVHGRAAHAGSSPEEGISAILELARQVERLFALNDPDRGITVNVGTIDGGLRPNVVAPEATAMVDVRAPTREAAEHVEREIRAPGPLPRGLTVALEGGFRRPPMVATPGNRELCRRARTLAARLGLAVGEAGLVGGASDANYTSELTPTLDGLGALGDGAHAADEHVVVHALPERAALLALLLLEPA
ncbi:MAG TPA: M20 family metallopeptidase [Gaiellaceae bacterium]|nr:M20 family metallopeptidase [Gaiellaceae bacterium]